MHRQLNVGGSGIGSIGSRLVGMKESNHAIRDSLYDLTVMLVQHLDQAPRHVRVRKVDASECVDVARDVEEASRVRRCAFAFGDVDAEFVEPHLQHCAFVLIRSELTKCDAKSCGGNGDADADRWRGDDRQEA